MSQLIDRPVAVLPLAEAVGAPALCALTEYVSKVRRADEVARGLYVAHPELRPWLQRITLDTVNGAPRVNLWVKDAGGVRVWAAALCGRVTEHESSQDRWVTHHTWCDLVVSGSPVHVWSIRSGLVAEDGAQ